MILLLLFFSVNGTRQSTVDAKILKDGKPLSAKDVEAIIHDDKIIFNIKKPAHSLSGKYQIKLKNDQGEDIKDLHINMQGNFIQSQYFRDIFNLPIVKLDIINMYPVSFYYRNNKQIVINRQKITNLNIV